MLICHSNEATVLPTTKLGKGIKSLNVDIKDAQGNDVTVNFGSSEWILPSATYKISNTVANMTCVVKVNGEAMQSGDLDVSIYGGVYGTANAEKESGRFKTEKSNIILWK